MNGPWEVLSNPTLTCTAIMLLESYTSVSRLINTEPSELLRLRLSEPIASESACQEKGDFPINTGRYHIIPCFLSVCFDDAMHGRYASFYVTSIVHWTFKPLARWPVGHETQVLEIIKNKFSCPIMPTAGSFQPWTGHRGLCKFYKVDSLVVETRISHNQMEKSKQFQIIYQFKIMIYFVSLRGFFLPLSLH